ncbi:MAG: UDP-N-acetylmuramate dehydrogenase [Candidatus Krumholzibacteriia bacterium]
MRHDRSRPAAELPAWAGLLLARRPDKVTLSVPLAELTTLRIGGPATAVCRIENAADAAMFQGFSRDHRLPAYVLGGGSNVLADDDGFPGLILQVATDTYRVTGTTVQAGAGLEFDRLIARTIADGLTGLEFASGIPGTLGGALVGNAGCFGHEIGEFLVEASVLLPDGTLAVLSPGDFGFGYRDSRLKESGAVVLAAVLRLRRGDTAAATREREERRAERLLKHPVLEPCAGSWFKNLPPAAPGERRRAAGELLDRAGARTLRVGGAAVFDRHANIVVNAGGATSAEVRELVRRMSAAVRDQFGIELEEEVRYLRPPRR